MLLLLVHEVHMRNEEPHTNKSDWSIWIELCSNKVFKMVGLPVFSLAWFLKLRNKSLGEYHLLIVFAVLDPCLLKVWRFSAVFLSFFLLIRWWYNYTQRISYLQFRVVRHFTYNLKVLYEPLFAVYKLVSYSVRGNYGISMNLSTVRATTRMARGFIEIP